jgi:prolipoprotein diacylglyceryltransferase
LASHGGVAGVMIALFLYQRSIRKQYPEFTFIGLLDMLAVPAPLASFCIRMGNFFNQEILGTPTNVPWAIIFGDPADGSVPQPLHPAQLYEAFAYLITFVILYSLWRKKGLSLRPGLMIGLMFIMIFGARFFVEFFKAHLSSIIDESFLQMGQYLSIPFVLLGIVFCFYGKFFPKSNGEFSIK